MNNKTLREIEYFIKDIIQLKAKKEFEEIEKQTKKDLAILNQKYKAFLKFEAEIQKKLPKHIEIYMGRGKTPTLNFIGYKIPFPIKEKEQIKKIGELFTLERKKEAEERINQIAKKWKIGE